MDFLQILFHQISLTLWITSGICRGLLLLQIYKMDFGGRLTAGGYFGVCCPVNYCFVTILYWINNKAIFTGRHLTCKRSFPMSKCHLSFSYYF